MRTPNRKFQIAAAVIAVLLGWLLLLPFHAPNPLVRSSYDLLQLLLPGHHQAAPIIIRMDEQAHADYGQEYGQPWSRKIHARLLDLLTRDVARVVVFDVVFKPGHNPADDDEFARALHRNGRVVLAGDRVGIEGVSRSYSILPPLEQFETNAVAWGIAKVLNEPDRVARRYDNGDDQQAGLAWAAATIAHAPVTQDPKRRLAEERWLNYYGSPRPFQRFSMTYSNAETMEPGFFHDKAVFIGGQPQTLATSDLTDVFGTPFTKWNSDLSPGVDIGAIAYTNLMDGTWLRRTGLLTELGFLLVLGFSAGFGLQQVRWPLALWGAFSMVALLVGGTVACVLIFRTWSPWVVGCGQVFSALLLRLLAERQRTSSPVPAQVPRAPHSPAGVTVAESPRFPLEVPDHTLIRCIGEGAYGQVWVARNAIGLYHAVKVVYRNRFPVEAPYDRALRGIQKFMPVSRSHEGFVHILHVGRNDVAGFFFYIMEAGDDENFGQQIDPLTYTPKTLASLLRHSEMLPPRDGLEIMIALTEAVERLHQHQLIHRDIKPGNIIFVDGRPKLADIDLVTDLSPHGDVSYIGTAGYMAPEGPGTAAADVFSLGRILYVTLTGKAPDQLPELPTRLASQPDCALLMELNQVCCKACEIDLGRRYSSAALMRADLLEIRSRLSPRLQG